MEMDLQEFGIIPIEIKKEKESVGLYVVGIVKNIYFTFSIKSKDSFIEHKNEYIKETLESLREKLWK